LSASPGHSAMARFPRRLPASRSTLCGT
jgi:hypothetical protein